MKIEDTRRKSIFVLICTLAAIGTIGAGIAFAKSLPTVGPIEVSMFKDMVAGFMRPAMDGWGIGFGINATSNGGMFDNTAAPDSFVTAKFHIVSVRSLQNVTLAQVLIHAKEDAASWVQVKDMLKAAIEANGTTVDRGRIEINRNVFSLTDIDRSDSRLVASVRWKPYLPNCTAQNLTIDDCEKGAFKIGYLSLRMKGAQAGDTKERVWAGTLNFNGTTYNFVSMVQDQGGK